MTRGTKLSVNGYDISELDQGYFKKILSILNQHPEGVGNNELAKLVGTSNSFMSTLVRRMIDRHDILSKEHLGKRKNSEVVIKSKIDFKEKEYLEYYTSIHTFQFRPGEYNINSEQPIIGWTLKEFSKIQQMNVIPFLLLNLSQLQNSRFSSIFNLEKGKYRSLVIQSQIDEVEDYLREYIHKNFSKKEIKNIERNFEAIKGIEQDRVRNILSDVRHLKSTKIFLPHEILFLSSIVFDPNKWFESQQSLLQYFIEEGDEDMEPKVYKEFRKGAIKQVENNKKSYEITKKEKSEFYKGMKMSQEKLDELKHIQEYTLEQLQKYQK